MYLHARFVELDKGSYSLTVDDEFESDAKLNCRENNIDSQGVSVYTKELYAPGLHIVESHIESPMPLTNIWVTEGLHVRFFFYLKGESSVRNGAGNQAYDHEVGLLQRNFLDANGGGGTAVIKANTPVNHIIVKMSRDFYLKLLQHEYWIGGDAFHHYILDGIPENRPNENLRVNLDMLHILESILHHERIGNRYHYVKLKIRELLFMIHQFTHQERKLDNIPPQTLETLKKVRSYLTINYQRPQTIPQLAKMFFIDEKKLKENFKAAYSMTVYAYVIQVRMKTAKEMLFKDYNVNEMAGLLGYQSVSHFIKVFKAHYGYTPKEAMVILSKMGIQTLFAFLFM